MSDINARMARDFARTMRALAKADALGARMPAVFARVLHPHPERERFVKPLADAELQQLQACVLRCRQLVWMIASEHQRLRLAHATARPSMERVIRFLERALGDSDTRAAEHVQRHHAELARTLRSVPDIGLVSVAAWLAERPEPGKLDRGRIAVLMGAVPLNRAPGSCAALPIA